MRGLKAVLLARGRVVTLECAQSACEGRVVRALSETRGRRKRPHVADRRCSTNP